MMLEDSRERDSYGCKLGLSVLSDSAMVTDIKRLSADKKTNEGKPSSSNT
jgi:hypothetical protein